MNQKQLIKKLYELHEDGDEFLHAEAIAENFMKSIGNKQIKDNLVELLNLCIDIVTCETYEREEKIGEIESFLR